MQVGDVVVSGRRGTVVVNQGVGIPDVVIPEVQGPGGTAAGNGLPQQHAAGVDIAVLFRHRADGLRRISAGIWRRNFLIYRGCFTRFLRGFPIPALASHSPP